MKHLNLYWTRMTGGVLFSHSSWMLEEECCWPTVFFTGFQRSEKDWRLWNREDEYEYSTFFFFNFDTDCFHWQRSLSCLDSSSSLDLKKLFIIFFIDTIKLNKIILMIIMIIKYWHRRKMMIRKRTSTRKSAAI